MRRIIFHNPVGSLILAVIYTGSTVILPGTKSENDQLSQALSEGIALNKK